MKRFLQGLGRVIATLTVVAIAGVVISSLWSYYIDAPWTRDGRVRADIVNVAPDVSGLVSDVLVHDNQQVHRGDVLFTIDRARFKLAVDQAQAVVESRRATLRRTTQDMDRYNSLSDIAASRQKQEQATADTQVAAAQYQQAVADLDLAKLNLERSVVRASVDGALTNFSMQPGQYVSLGKGVAALVATSSLHVDGYFEETRLPRIHVGDAVSIHLMGETCSLRGHVESIAVGTEDRERTESADMLANINPTFSWVRLAQRIPVRVALDAVPPNAQLVVGRTATVVVENAYMQPSWYSHGLLSRSAAAAITSRTESACDQSARP
ncbi:HlyD family secretion protein [Telmatospirillum sp.]|uniref:HlyD family secretion protein n=1 Tax=Telmatospirillum sp. TaxID=2079197 RepID=UPI00284AE2EA|nr:HlyD family secretion protein [Telmatospirillum sp.]MDR3436529.1 HlyD family secretion protein [Telmatospirillum sp.]